MAEELKACPFCSCTDIGEVTINLILEPHHRRFKVYCKACQCRTSEHKTRKEARIYWNTRAQLPSKGGEAVEVVAYIDGGGAIYTARLLEIMSVEPYGCEPLMTVAQHQRILAAATHPADQVAEPDAELVALLQDASQWFADRDIDINLARDIDAKLASL